MQISKKDDQALATIGRLAGYNPIRAKSVALKMSFENQELELEVHSFWNSVQIRNTLDGLSVKYNQTSVVMEHWLEAFMVKATK